MNSLPQLALLLLAMLSHVTAAIGEPIKLKLAYFSSDRSTTYLACIKPFVEAVNAEAAGIEIDVSLSGALGKNPTQQLQLVLDGTADIAFIVPGYTPERFSDNLVVELPGMFRNIREATLVYTRLLAGGALRGYEDVVVVGAFATEPETVHARSPVVSLEDLKGKRIRANNISQAAALENLGAIAVQMPINQASSGLSSGKIDGATVSPAPLVEFGISRLAAYHYLLGIGAAPLAVIMNRKKFESLPGPSQDVIRKFGGEWTAEHYIAMYGAENERALERLRSEPNRTLTIPS